MLLALSLAGGIFTKAYTDLGDGNREGKLQVVTSFYPVYIAALNVLGSTQSVSLQNLSEPQAGCLHDYQLAPQDMVLISKADLFLVNGGGIEGFLAEVAEAYPGLAIAETTEGIELLGESGSHAHGHSHTGGEGLSDAGRENEEGENAHAWMDTRLYARMVQNIAESISTLDPQNAAAYQQNADAYCQEIEALSAQVSEIQAYVSEVSGQMPPVVIFHEAYAYVAGQYGFETAYCMDLDEERQVSAREVADVLEEISAHQVPFAFAEELYGKDMGDAVEAESSCSVCYLDPLVRGGYDAGSYLSAMQENIDKIKQLVYDVYGREGASCRK